MLRPSSSRLLKRLGLLGSVAFAACGGGAGLGGAAGSLPSTGSLQVVMHDSPVSGVDHVYVTIERVDVVKINDDASESVSTITSVPGQYDLLQLQQGVEAVLGGGSFDPGHYAQIRLIVSRDSKKDIKKNPADTLKNYVVVEGVAHPLVVPSGEKTGIKLGHDFTIEAGVTTTITLDFDVRQSLRICGDHHHHNAVYRLRPRIRVVEVTSTPIDTPPSGGTGDTGGGTGDTGGGTGGSTQPAFTGITGTISTTDNSAVPADTVVSVQQGGVEIASSGLDATNTYSVTGLADGTYDVVVIAPGSTFASTTGVVVSNGGTDSTHDLSVASLNEEVSWISGTITSSDLTMVTVTVHWNGFLVATVGCDDTGAYFVGNLPAGTYTVTASGPGGSNSGDVTINGGGAIDLNA